MRPLLALACFVLAGCGDAFSGAAAVPAGGDDASPPEAAVEESPPPDATPDTPAPRPDATPDAPAPRPDATPDAPDPTDATDASEEPDAPAVPIESGPPTYTATCSPGTPWQSVCVISDAGFTCNGHRWSCTSDGGDLATENDPNEGLDLSACQYYGGGYFCCC